jgi:nucleoside-triphosphatase THEP1
MGVIMANVLLTGAPGIGKTTIIQEFVRRAGRRCGGFFTSELRDASGQRTGFSITSVDGSLEAVLASTGPGAGPRVGRYRVDLDAIDRVGIPALEAEGTELFVIDEIGKMELLSRPFREQLLTCLDKENVVATIAQKGGGAFVETIKNRPDVEVIEVTMANRDRLVWDLLDRLG